MTTPEPTSQPYLTGAETRAFAAARGLAVIASADNAGLEAAVLRASEWLDSSFVFIGQPAQRGQPRAFPRTGLGPPHAPAEAVTPAPVYQAAAELAAALLVSEAEAEQLLGLRGAVSREQVGDVVVSWRARRGAQGRLAHLLRAYLQGGQSGQSGSVRLHRS